MEKKIKEKDRMPVKKLKVLKLIIVGLVAFQVAVIIVTILSLKGRGGEGSDDGGGSFVSFFPIWIAVFIPILASKKKKERASERSLWILVGLAGLVLLGSLVFLFFTLR